MTNSLTSVVTFSNFLKRLQIIFFIITEQLCLTTFLTTCIYLHNNIHVQTILDKLCRIHQNDFFLSVLKNAEVNIFWVHRKTHHPYWVMVEHTDYKLVVSQFNLYSIRLKHRVNSLLTGNWLLCASTTIMIIIVIIVCSLDNEKFVSKIILSSWCTGRGEARGHVYYTDDNYCTEPLLLVNQCTKIDEDIPITEQWPYVHLYVI